MTQVRWQCACRNSLIGYHVWVLFTATKVEYIVRVPQGIHLDASCVSSGLNVSGLTGVFKFKTVSGDSNLVELTVRSSFNAVSGDTMVRIWLVYSIWIPSQVGAFVGIKLSFGQCFTVSGDIILQTLYRMAHIISARYLAMCACWCLPIRIATQSSAV